MASTTWNDELKGRLSELYTELNPSPENTIECVKQATETLNAENDAQFSSNGARMILQKAGIYIPQGAATGAKPKAAASGAAGATTRVSKESAVNELREAITSLSAEIDDDILSKLTGKAALYFAAIIRKAS